MPRKKTLKVYILKKKHDINGNPIYYLFIPELSGKHEGLRKLKNPHMYSIQAYNVGRHLREYALKNYNVKIEDEWRW
jgi:hypothetical protein